MNSYTTPDKKHYTVGEQADRLPLYLQEYYQERQLDRIKIDNNEIQGYFEYSFMNEKTYFTSPERSSGGSIDNLNSYATFLVPRIVIKYNYMHINDYRTLMRLIQSKNEFTVECYDIVWDKRVTHKMYVSPTSMPSIHQRYLEVLGVKDFTVELIGTNSDVDKISIVYHSNFPSSYPPSITEGESDVYANQEIIIGTAAKQIKSTSVADHKFSHWEDENGNTYTDGVAYSFPNSITLKAEWVGSTECTLLLNYGIADPEINDSEYSYVTSIPVKYGQKIESIPTVKPPTVKAKDINGVEREYPYVYTDGAWYKTPIKAVNSESVSNGTSYWAQTDSSIYLIYEVTKYNLFLYVDGNLFLTNTIEYNTPMNLPHLVQSGKTFDGWYVDSQYKNKRANGNMPPYDLTLYARFK
jgi:uncharacterized repeat protein (TIGR02543 family)